MTRVGLQAHFKGIFKFVFITIKYTYKQKVMTSKRAPTQIYENIPNLISEVDNVVVNPKKIVNDLLRSTVPMNDLKTRLSKKELCYMNIKKREYFKTKKQFRGFKKRRLSRKERKQLGLLKCPKTGWNYNELKPLRVMWKEYMTDVLNTTPKEKLNKEDCLNLNRLMSKADLHGAELEVIKSKNPSLIGLEGTCVVDSKETFGIVSKENKYKVIPKKECVFKINLYTLSITIFGKYLVQRSGERSVKKIKSFMVPTL